MNVWILKFMPYQGSVQHALFFKTREMALKTRDDALDRVEKCPDTGVILRDDFGIELSIDLRMCAIVLTDCETSAKFIAAIGAANAHAEKLYGLNPGALGPMQ